MRPIKRLVFSFTAACLAAGAVGAGCGPFDPGYGYYEQEDVTVYAQIHVVDQNGAALSGVTGTFCYSFDAEDVYDDPIGGEGCVTLDTPTDSDGRTLVPLEIVACQKLSAIEVKLITDQTYIGQGTATQTRLTSDGSPNSPALHATFKITP